MVALFSDQTNEGRHFRQNIRAYNHAFAFTSMGVHVDERINIGGSGIYTFRAQGALYHKIGGLLPHEGNRPRFLQAYIYDTEHEVENRMCESEVLDRCVVEKIQHMLNNHNPFVHTLRSLGQRQDLPNCKLILKEQPIDRRQYSLPSASQVVAIIIDGDDATIANGRDIVVETISGRLSHVRDYVGFYDPLQYPLLLPYGTYGWDVNSRDDGGRAITCCDYYAYMLQVCSIGRRIILPSSFVRSPRDMYQRYQDAMTLVQRFGKPDLFITMTCNPSWEEIKSELLAGQTPQDRPDLLTRVFRAKLERLKEDIIEKEVLGNVVAYAYVIEFQKRGLPHVHMLVVLDENDKINNPDEYDRIVRAEIPNEDVEPQLYNVVLKHMIHGPCEIHNPQSPCMKNGSCKRKYPKPFAPVTVQGNDSYPIYQRRGNRLPVSLDRQGNIMVDNSWVIPYNPWLLLRWVCAPEALWKIFKFIINRIYPSVERLQIHLPNMHQVQFRADESIINILHDECTRKTMLTEFFTLNHVDAEARQYVYMEIPSHYRWIQAQRKWSKRMNRNKVIGRIYAVSPAKGEKFYLRILLNHVRGPTFFTNLRTVNGVLHPTFKQAAEQRGLLERDDTLDRTFRDLTDIDLPFGGKIMIFGGDFRQVLPVIRKGTKSELIQASVVKASFWSQVKILKLKQNMRSINDREFSEFLLRVGDGNEDVIMDDLVKLPECMVIPWESEQSINQLIAKIFPNLEDHMNDATYMVERAVVTPTNEDVDMLNEKIINMFPGLEETMYSFDSVEDDERNLYQPEFLNSISLGGLPPHKLTLKRGAPIMLLRNIDPKLGLCNGTRLLCRGSYRNLIDAEILTGQFAGSRVFLPRIPLKSTDTAGLPFELTRKQFPVKLSFSITINKSQGQTIPHVGVYLPDHVFSHGQLYVALSRGVSKSTTTVLVKNGSIVGQQGVFTRNIGNENLKCQSGTNGWKLQH
ncbi:unnamed protein product [Malus baccata var. baccata]